MTYPPTCVVGPFAEFKDYINFVEKKGRYSEIPFSPVKAGLKMVQALACLSISFGFMSLASYIFGGVSLNDYLISKDFANQPFYMKLFICLIMADIFKYKAYMCWFFGDSGNICSGFAYSGKNKDGKPEFNHVRTHFLEVELATSPRDLINHWNFQTTTFFRRYVYERVMNNEKKNQSKATLATFVYSAVWHGLYTGYLLFFVQCHFFLSAARKTRTLFNWIPAVPAKILGWLWSQHIIFVN